MSNPYIKIEPRDHYLLITAMSDEVSVLMDRLTQEFGVVASIGRNEENDEIYIINHYGEKASGEAGQVLSAIHNEAGLSHVGAGSVNRLLGNYWLELVDREETESIVLRRHLLEFNKDLDSVLDSTEAHNLITGRGHKNALMDLRISETNKIVTIRLEVPDVKD